MNAKAKKILFDAQEEVAIMQISRMLRKARSGIAADLCFSMRLRMPEFAVNPVETHPMLERFECHRDKVLDSIWDKLCQCDTTLLELFMERLTPDNLEDFCERFRPKIYQKTKT